MKKLASQEYWTGLERDAPKERHPFLFGKLFKKYLPNGKGKVVFEIGCAPGTMLAPMCAELGYFPEGIDYDKKTRRITSKTLELYGFKKYRLYEADFFKWKPKKKYDIVCSFGFIEHFDDPSEIIRKQVEMTKKDGIVIIEVPNFSGIRGKIHSIVDKENLSRHNTSIMNKKFFKNVAKKHNLRILHLDYSGGFNINWENHNPKLYQKMIYYPLKIIGMVTKRIPLKSRISPFIVMIARKPY